MTERRIKKQLKRYLEGLTPGSLLSILAEIYHHEAERARWDGDERVAEQCRTAESALIVMGHGLDAILPR